MRRISWSPNDCYAADDNTKKVDMIDLFHDYGIGRYYWEFLGDPGRCGLLYNEPAKCYTHIINCWLLSLRSPPDLEGPNSPVQKVCRNIVLGNWSRILSKCVPGDKDLICRLRDFTLDKASKEEVERVIAWLKVSLQYFDWLIFTSVACCR